MQITSSNNSTSFGRISFVDKATKKAFYKKLRDGRSFNGLTQEAGLLKQHFCRFALDKEACRHDRLLKIGMTKVKGNNVFTCEGQPILTDKKGKQSIFTFVTELFLMSNKRYRDAMAKTMVNKGIV